MGEFDPVPVDGDQPGPDERFEDRVRRTAAVGAGADRGDLGGVQPGVRGLGAPREGAAHAAHPLVRLQGERTPGAAAPGLPEGVRQHRQPAGPAGDLLDERLRQGPFDDEPSRGGRSADRLAQPRLGHPAQGKARVPDRGREAGVFQAARAEVRADAQDDTEPAGRVGGRDERRGVRGEGAPPRSEDAHGGRALPGVPGVAQARDQPGAQERGRAASRRAEHADEPVSPREAQVCPNGGAHSAQGFNFALPHV